LISEQQRRAYLSAMQVVSWLPAQVLPFAAASRPTVLREVESQPAALASPQVEAVAAVSARVAPVSGIEQVRAGLEPSSQPAQQAAPAVAKEAPAALPRAPTVSVPRFSLQLYRAGACLLLVELPTGEAFQSRDPAYLLLKDLLRAAGLPDSPQLLGDPVRWPLLVGGNLDQGPAAARDFLHGFLAAQIEEGPGCACLWLVGLPALRHAGEAEEDMYNRELQIDGIGPAWAVPGLELLMDEPQRKAPLWQAMRRLMQRWMPVDA
jgi:hypothetical protein